MNLTPKHADSDTPFKKCAIYTRVSTDEQAAKEHNSCEVQDGMCAELIERNRRNGWIRCVSISDPGYSGKNLNRPGMRRLLEMVKRDEIQVIVVYRRDR